MNGQPLWTVESLNSQFGLKKKYREFNKRYFDGKLQGCNFKTELPQKGEKPLPHVARVFSRTRWHGGWVATMCFTADMTWNEETFDKVLIHEMVHYYLHVTGKASKWFPHGRTFRQECRRLKRCYGLDVKKLRRFEIFHMNEIPPKTRWEKFLFRHGHKKTTGPYATEENA